MPLICLPFWYSTAAALTYTQKVQALYPMAYWPLNETSGTTAADASGNGRNGVYSGATLGQGGIGDGNTAPLFDGVNDLVNVQSTSLTAAFNGSEGTLAFWMKAANWSGGGTRYVTRFASDGSNEVAIWQSSTAGRLLFDYRAGGTLRQVQINGIVDTGWIALACTWSKTADVFNAWMYGAQVDFNQNSLGIWSGTNSQIRHILGAQTPTGTSAFSGQLAHAALWGRALDGTVIAALATV